MSLYLQQSRTVASIGEPLQRTSVREPTGRVGGVLLGRTDIVEPAHRIGVGKASGWTSFGESNSLAQCSKPGAANMDIRDDYTAPTGLGGNGPMPSIRADMFKAGLQRTCSLHSQGQSFECSSLAQFPSSTSALSPIEITDHNHG